MSAFPTHTPGGTSFLQRFEGLNDHLPGAAIPAVAALRAEAAEVFRATGLPTRRVEAWRYTDLSQLSRAEFREALLAVEDAPALPVARCAHRAVFLDGRFRAELSTLPEGARPLSEALHEAVAHMGRPDSERPLEALNAMLFEDGLVLELGEGVDGGEIEILSVATGPAAMAFHPRHQIRLARGAKLSLIETATGPEGSQHFHNPVFDIDVAEGANLIHVRAQREPDTAYHLAQINVRVAGGGVYDAFALNAGGKVSRCEIHLILAGPKAEAHLNGAQLASDGQVADVTTLIEHNEPDCASRQTVKTVLTGKSRGVFQGKILVRRPAQKTDGYQMNQSLLLSEDAEMDSKPQLEIYADDVKCSHGATVGALDPDQLFYLRSRGVPGDQARAMLVRAFLDEAIEIVRSDTARAALEEAIAVWWTKHGGLSLPPEGEAA
ncbi:Fe-S cluster assembly protein SufD [Roseomonas elaeocarpi]|uniref:Fe-S cluster assembly protein SufD n=1 Tax=Roseomonas elaeocarpi TaxID=907779 RepID=A0ABV6JUD9_9PROT